MTVPSITEALRSAGLHARIVPVTRIPEIRQDVISLLEDGSLEPSFYRTRLLDLKYSLPGDMPNARSIIVVAVPQPKIIIRFIRKGIVMPVVVPPTYANAVKVMERVRETLIGATGGEDATFERAALPLKTLASRSGLVKYGRNNITYLEGHGSFHRLVAFYTDLDLETDDWQLREMLPGCDGCRRCLEACPVSAIAQDRFLVHAERCLTYLNEFPSDHDFPKTVGPETHNAIVGCMVCQNVCPYNRGVRDWAEDGETFTEEETEYLLRGDFGDDAAMVIDQKLERCGLDLTIFPRNLDALLKGP